MRTGTEDQYPHAWDEFVGQDKAVRELKVKISAARKRGTRLGHVLLRSRYPGIGKSSLAFLIAAAMETNIWPISGQPNLGQLRLFFSQMDDGDILFFDEIHKAADGGKAKAEWLLHVLQDGVLMTPFGTERIPDITIIGTTTDAGKLPTPVLERFEIQPELVPYTDEEGAGIVRVMSERLLVAEGLPRPDETTALAIALAATNRPRWMRRILTSLRDLAQADEVRVTQGGTYDLSEAFDFVGVTDDGLTVDAVKYLRVLAEELRGEPAGAALLRERLGEVGTGLAEIEMLLLDKDLIAKTKQGRILTGSGMRRVRTLGLAA